MIDSLRVQTKSNSTAFMKALRSGSSQLNSCGARTHWQLWSPASALGLLYVREKSQKAAAAMLASQPELAHFPALLQEYFITLGERCPEYIIPTPAGVLCGRVPWLEGTDKTELQVVHASSNCWGRPWLDSVSVRGQSATGQFETWYGKSIMFFWAGDRMLAFLQWFIRVPAARGDTLAKHGCIPLIWEMVGAKKAVQLTELPGGGGRGGRGGGRGRGRGRGKARGKGRGQKASSSDEEEPQPSSSRSGSSSSSEEELSEPKPCYAIVDFQRDIMSREYVMPDFSLPEGQGFHVSAFKWNRAEPDTLGFDDVGTDDDSDSDGDWEYAD